MGPGVKITWPGRQLRSTPLVGFPAMKDRVVPGTSGTLRSNKASLVEDVC